MRPDWRTTCPTCRATQTPFTLRLVRVERGLLLWACICGAVLVPQPRTAMRQMSWLEDA